MRRREDVCGMHVGMHESEGGSSLLSFFRDLAGMLIGILQIMGILLSYTSLATLPTPPTGQDEAEYG